MSYQPNLYTFNPPPPRPRCVPVIFSHPSRVDIRRQTLLYLAQRSDLAPPMPHVWTGVGRDVEDFRALIAAPLLDDADLLFMEDDIEPCRNGYRYMLDWASPYAPGRSLPMMTSFYNPYRKVGINTGFIFSQAFKLPQWMVARMRIEQFPPPHAKLQRDGIDQVVHRYLARWSMPFWQHRSIVQHVGEASTWTKSTLQESGRRSIDWPGPEADALTFAWGGAK